MKSKGGEFGFVWIFAILAGVAILLLMIYGATKAIDTERIVQDTKLAAALISELDTLEAGSVESIKATIRLSNPTNVSVGCFETGYGDNRVQISTKSNRGSGEWSTGEEIIVKDKYIFSDSNTESKALEVNSKSFAYPYKIADLIFLTSNNYCFKNAPQKLKRDYSSLNGISFDNCSSEQVTVCFNAYGCDILVDGMCSDDKCETIYDYGTVTKAGEIFYYADSLLLAAVISDMQNYDCNVKRLMYRGGKIAEMLIEKASLANARGCHTILTPYLELFRLSFPIYVQDDFASNTDSVLEINELNEEESCGLW